MLIKLKKVDSVNATIPDKPYFTIGEVSKLLKLETYVIRYWESEFKTVKPIRTGADQRRYRKKDIEALIAIKQLLYEEGFTIAGARKRLNHVKREAEEQPDQRDLGQSDLEKLLNIKKGLQELKDMIG